MSSEFVAAGIWRTLTAATKRCHYPAYVAVAYFGRGAAKRLPLPPNSFLVVDASEAAVKSGQTCPAELLMLLKKGVKIHSVPNLHAKVFVLGRTAFIGSANVSDNSADSLVEAMVAVTEPAAVSKAKAFVKELCLHELGEESLKRLERLYRPPRFLNAGRKAKSRTPRKVRGSIPNVYIAQLTLGSLPEEAEVALEEGRKAAEQRLRYPKRHKVDVFWQYDNCPYKVGDIVVQVLKKEDGRLLVSPSGTVLKAPSWHKGKRTITFVYLEVLRRRRVEIERLSARLAPDVKKRLYRGGRVRPELATQLLEAWNS
jgi:hypothetical protein